ncbi:MAG: hypothetical protein R6W90_10275 [Ignavibacteriaceae bacterium]
MYKYKIFLLIILVQISLYAQSYTLSANVKISALHSEQFDNNKYEKSLKLYPLSIYIGNTFNLDDDYQLEVSPGILFGGETFGGFETGIYLRRNLGDTFFGGIGTNFHYNSGLGHGTTVEEYVPDGPV